MQTDSKFARTNLKPPSYWDWVNWISSSTLRERLALECWSTETGLCVVMSADVLSGGRAGETEHQERVVDRGYCLQSRLVTAGLQHSQRGSGPRSHSHTPPERSPTCPWWGVTRLLTKTTISLLDNTRRGIPFIPTLHMFGTTCLDSRTESTHIISIGLWKYLEGKGE